MEIKQKAQWMSLLLLLLEVLKGFFYVLKTALLFERVWDNQYYNGLEDAHYWGVSREGFLIYFLTEGFMHRRNDKYWS